MTALTRAALPLCLLASAGCTNEREFFSQTGTDTWAQAENDRVDILFVVDDSGSMAPQQAALVDGFSAFADMLESSGTRFHLGVVTTSFDFADPDRGRLVGDGAPFLTWQTPDYEQQFAERAIVGTNGSDFERGLAAAAYALSPVINLDVNGGFSRPDARLLIVFVSDEEDCSDDGAFGPNPDNGEVCYFDANRLAPIADYVTAFRGLRERSRDVVAAAIVGLPDGQACQAAAPGLRYAEVVRLMGGIVGDICETDWGGILGRLGLNATGIYTSFQLSNAAIPDTIEVYVDDVLQQDGWRYDPETWYIHFDELAVPPRESEIVATYTVLHGQPRPPGADEAPPAAQPSE